MELLLGINIINIDEREWSEDARAVINTHDFFVNFKRFNVICVLKDCFEGSKNLVVTDSRSVC